MDHNAAGMYFERRASAATPRVLPYALVTIGSNVLAPRPLHQDRPSLRVYGTFPTKEDAKEHMTVVRAIDPTCSYLVVDTGTWCLIPQSEETLYDKEANAERTRQVMAQHTESVEATRRDFDERKQTKAEVERTHLLEHERQEEEAEAEVYAPPKRMRAGGEVRGQAAVVIGVVPSTTGECLFNVFGCFETTEEANVYVVNVASREHTNQPIIVDLTCEWIFPNAACASKIQYRHAELQRIMDAVDNNTVQVKEFKEWMQSEAALDDASTLSQDAEEQPLPSSPA